jgi:hypothetical protein
LNIKLIIMLLVAFVSALSGHREGLRAVASDAHRLRHAARHLPNNG